MRCAAPCRSIAPSPSACPTGISTRAAANALAEHFGTRDLAGFGVHDEELALAAAGALYRYAQATQLQALAHVTQLTVEHEGASCASTPPPGATWKFPRPCAASPPPPCSRCSTPAPPAWARAGCATACTTR
jgi:hypothetical protein